MQNLKQQKQFTALQLYNLTTIPNNPTVSHNGVIHQTHSRNDVIKQNLRDSQKKEVLHVYECSRCSSEVKISVSQQVKCPNCSCRIISKRKDPTRKGRSVQAI